MGFVEDIRQIAEAGGYAFIYGSSEYVNREMGGHDLQNKDLIFVYPQRVRRTFEDGTLDKITYNVVIGLGVKNDGTFQATQDEYFEQKHDRRLAQAELNIYAVIKQIMCKDNYTAITDTFYPEINQFDENIDIIFAEMSFEYREEEDPIQGTKNYISIDAVTRRVTFLTADQNTGDVVKDADGKIYTPALFTIDPFYGLICAPLKAPDLPKGNCTVYYD